MTHVDELLPPRQRLWALAALLRHYSVAAHELPPELVANLAEMLDEIAADLPPLWDNDANSVSLEQVNAAKEAVRRYAGVSLRADVTPRDH